MVYFSLHNNEPVVVKTGAICVVFSPFIVESLVGYMREMGWQHVFFGATTEGPKSEFYLFFNEWR